MRAMTQQPPHGQEPPAYGGYGPPPPNHPQATTVLVLGIVGVLVCGIVAPFAWVMGNRVIHEIDASGGRWGGRTEANVGRILGIVLTVLLIASFFLVVLVFTLGGVIASSFSTS
jgi:uncharacterized membrane protein YjgN (DUF898 family)